MHNSLDNYLRQVSNGKCNFSVIVVDDGSTDGSSEWINENFPSIHILKGDGSLWWTGAVDKGSRYAVQELQAEYVILWNDDTECDINYFVELDKVIKEKPELTSSILAAKVLWVDEMDILYNFGWYYSRKTGKKVAIGFGKTDSGEYSEITPIDWSGGMGTVIPSTILQKINYFDVENFPHYHGDIDFFLRAGKCGFKAFVIPTLKIYNNRESTGLVKTKNFKDLKNLFVSNRSNYNIKQNLLFNKRHANTLLSWFYLSYRYSILTSKSIIRILFFSKKMVRFD